MRRWMIAFIFGGGGLLVFLGLAPSETVAAVLPSDPRSTWKPTMLTTKQKFVQDLLTALAEGLSALSMQARLLIVAHGAYESDWGRTKAAQQGFNFWNLSAGSWTGPVIGGGDKEYDAAGNVKKIAQRWRQYGSAVEAVQDYKSFLNYRNYRPHNVWGSLTAGDPNFIYGLRSQHEGGGGFFTEPFARYQANFNAQHAEVQQVAATLTDTSGGGNLIA